jgi:hypothetical protein
VSKKPYPLNVEDYPDPYAWMLKTRTCCTAYVSDPHRPHCPEHAEQKAARAAKAKQDLAWTEIEIDPGAQNSVDYRQCIARVKTTKITIEDVPTGWRRVVKAIKQWFRRLLGC